MNRRDSAQQGHLRPEPRDGEALENVHTAERSVLAAMLLRDDAIRRARVLINTACFDRVAHQKIFAAIVGLHARGGKADAITLTAELIRLGDLEAVGGPAEIAHILEYATTTANLEEHIKIVREFSKMGRLQRILRAFHERSAGPGHGSQVIIGLLESELGGLKATRDGEGEGEGEAVVTRLSSVEAQPVEWMWRDYIPLGMLTVLDGDPGLGKSTMMLDLATRQSQGLSMPDGSTGTTAAGVVILSAEDDLSRVIRPRLEAAGGDLEVIATVGIRGQRGEQREPTICPADLAAVEQAIREVGARLVIVDPLMAYLPADVNAHRDQDVRRALAALRALAERTGAAVVVIRHLNKGSGGAPLYRGGGSIGIIGAARAGLLLAADPDDSAGNARVLAVTKSNLAPQPPSLRLRLIPDQGATHARVRWEGQSPHTAITLLAVEEDAKESSTRREKLAEQALARAAEMDRAAAALREEVAAWAADGRPMRKREDAVPFLVDQGVARDPARKLILERSGCDWRIEGGGRKGNPEVLLPYDVSAGIPPDTPHPHQKSPPGGPDSGGRMKSEPPESATLNPTPMTHLRAANASGGSNGGPPESDSPRAAVGVAEITQVDSGRHSQGLEGEQADACSKCGAGPASWMRCLDAIVCLAVLPDGRVCRTFVRRPAESREVKTPPALEVGDGGAESEAPQ